MLKFPHVTYKSQQECRGGSITWYDSGFKEDYDGGDIDPSFCTPAKLMDKTDDTNNTDDTDDTDDIDSMSSMSSVDSDESTSASTSSKPKSDWYLMRQIQTKA